MQKITSLLLVVLAILLGADRVVQGRVDLPDWAKEVQEVHLKNSITFLLYPRGEAPIFSAYIRFRAGGMDEEGGQTGLAHFLEHMAFKGTASIGVKDYEKEKPILDEIEKIGVELSKEYEKGEKGDPTKINFLREKLRSLHEEQLLYLDQDAFSRKMLEAGGVDLNATTSKDATSYFVSLPSDKIRFWAEIESQRIFEPVFREFYEEKDVVLEERSSRIDNDPDGKLYAALLENAFQKSPYRWPTIGSRQDLLKLTIGDLRRFWKKHYRPDQMIGVLVGQFDAKEVEKILKETFGQRTFEDEPSLSDKIPEEPKQTKERQVIVHLPARPRMLIGYHKPTLPAKEDYAFDLLQQILTDGRSSRLYRKLILEKKLAGSVSSHAGIPGSRQANLFLIQIEPLPGHTPDEILKVLDEEFEKLREDGVTPHELQKAKNRLMVDHLWGLKTNEGLASQLSYFQIIAGDWHYAATYLDEINRLQADDLKEAAATYLRPTNRTTAILSSTNTEKMP